MIATISPRRCAKTEQPGASQELLDKVEIDDHWSAQMSSSFQSQRRDTSYCPEGNSICSGRQWTRANATESVQG